VINLSFFFSPLVKSDGPRQRNHSQVRVPRDSRPYSTVTGDEDFFSIYLILPAALGPGYYSASNRNEYQMIFLVGEALPARKANNLTIIN
jgi:hypothetical protein